MAEYHYTECGLDNVYIEGEVLFQDHTGEELVTFPAVRQLHQVIAEGIVTQPVKMTERELRFLRSERGLTQVQLAKFIKVTPLTVRRWERGESPIQHAAEMLIRLTSTQRLELDIDLDVEAVSEKVEETATVQEIRIKGNERGQYSLLDAA